MAHVGKFNAQSYPEDASQRAPQHPPHGPNKPKPSPKWLDTWSDQVATLDTTSHLMASSDLAGDGEWRLVIASASDKKLKVWRYVCWAFPKSSLPVCPYSYQKGRLLPLP